MCIEVEANLEENTWLRKHSSFFSFWEFSEEEIMWIEGAHFLLKEMWYFLAMCCTIVSYSWVDKDFEF